MRRLLIISLTCLCLQSRAQSAPQTEVTDSVNTDVNTEVYSTALARALFEKNDFKGARKIYEHTDTSNMPLRDLTNYAMAAFFTQRYHRVLAISQCGLQRTPGHADFLRLAFFSSTELHDYKQAAEYAKTLFSQCDTSQLHYYDYAYYVRLCQAQPPTEAADWTHLIESYQYLISYYLNEKNDRKTARRYARRLLAIEPEDQTARQVLEK